MISIPVNGYSLNLLIKYLSSVAIVSRARLDYVYNNIFISLNLPDVIVYFYGVKLFNNVYGQSEIYISQKTLCINVSITTLPQHAVHSAKLFDNLFFTLSALKCLGVIYKKLLYVQLRKIPIFYRSKL